MPKVGVILSKKRLGTKKGLFVILFAKRFANQLKVIHGFEIYFATVIRNYPKSDLHFAMRHCLFPAQYTSYLQATYMQF